MKTRILKQLSEHVRMREHDNEFLVERKTIEGNWDIIGRSFRIERALMKKHNYWYSELGRLNYSGRLLNRRKARELKRRKNK